MTTHKPAVNKHPVQTANSVEITALVGNIEIEDKDNGVTEVVSFDGNESGELCVAILNEVEEDDIEKSVPAINTAKSPAEPDDK